MKIVICVRHVTCRPGMRRACSTPSWRRRDGEDPTVTASSMAAARWQRAAVYVPSGTMPTWFAC